MHPFFPARAQQRRPLHAYLQTAAAGTSLPRRPASVSVAVALGSSSGQDVRPPGVGGAVEKENEEESALGRCVSPTALDVNWERRDDDDEDAAFHTSSHCAFNSYVDEDGLDAAAACKWAARTAVDAAGDEIRRPLSFQQRPEAADHRVGAKKRPRDHQSADDLQGESWPQQLRVELNNSRAECAAPGCMGGLQRGRQARCDAQVRVGSCTPPLTPDEDSVQRAAGEFVHPVDGELAFACASSSASSVDDTQDAGTVEAHLSVSAASPFTYPDRSSTPSRRRAPPPHLLWRPTAVAGCPRASDAAAVRRLVFQQAQQTPWQDDESPLHTTPDPSQDAPPPPPPRSTVPASPLRLLRDPEIPTHSSTQQSPQEQHRQRRLCELEQLLEYTHFFPRRATGAVGRDSVGSACTPQTRRQLALVMRASCQYYGALRDVSSSSFL